MVQIKKKVTIKTKTAQEETPVADPKPEVKIKEKSPVVEEPKAPPTPPTPPEENGGSKVWMWVVALIVVAVIAFFGYKSCSGSEIAKPGNDKDSISVVSDSTQTEKDDTVGTEKPESTDDGVAKESQDNGSETDIPATSNSQTNGAEVSKLDQKPVESVSSAPTSIDKPVAQTASVSGSVEEKARQVIRGDYGKGQERKDKLGAAYTEIQGKVNEIYRQKKGH